jgi:hypothetical protein
VLFGNRIVGNAGIGLHVYQSFVGATPFGTSINGNVVGSNGWDVACTGTESAAQIVVDGPAVVPPAVTAACSAHLDEPTCDADRANACIFNVSAVANPCRPSYLLSTSSCFDSNANQITGYDRTGTENEDFRVAIVVANGAWVNAINASFLTTAFQVGLDWAPVTSDSFAGNGGSTCPSAANKCPAMP